MSDLTRAEKVANGLQMLINFRNQSGNATQKTRNSPPLQITNEHSSSENINQGNIFQPQNSKVSMDEIVNINAHSISQDPEMKTFNASQFFDNLPNTNSTTFLNIESTPNPIITHLNTIQGIPENFALEENNDLQKSNQISIEEASYQNLTQDSRNANSESLIEKLSQLNEIERAVEESNQKIDQIIIQKHSYPDQVKELQGRNHELEKKIQTQQEQYDKQTQNLQEFEKQMQSYVQTIGILVAEKTELESALNKSQEFAKIKASECEEIQSNLKSSKYHIEELSHELSSLKTTHKTLEEKYQQYELQENHYESIINETKQELMESNQLREETSVKLNEALANCAQLEKQLVDKTQDLNLTQIRLQQLGLAEETNPSESTTVQEQHLEEQLKQAETTLSETKKAHEQQMRQFQTYIKQLNGQLQQLNEQNIQYQSERDTLSFREQERIDHVSRLEKQLQEMQMQFNQTLLQFEQHKDKTSFDSNKQNTLESENQDLKNKLANFEEMIKEKDSKINDLNYQICSLNEDQLEVESNQSLEEQTQLLAAIESDKVAASRAMSQNQMLKSQLDVMTECFNNINESKLELMETLHRERRETRRLRETVYDYEKELNRLRDRLLDAETKLAEASGIPLTEWQERWRHHHNQMETNHDHSNEHNHYHDHSHEHDHSHNHDQEHGQAHEHTHEHDHTHNHDHDCEHDNEQEHDELSNHHDQQLFDKDKDENKSENDSENCTDESTKDQAEITEVNEVKNSDEIQNKNGICEVGSIEKTTQTTLQQSSKTNSVDSNSLRKAMEQLQVQFTRKMSQIAELNDEKQRLEHIVMQLQSETETIGEYVALYQTQRCALRERAKEKDEALRQLARDKDEMRCKLTRLESLVARLVDQNKIPQAESHSSDMKKEIDDNLKSNENVENSETQLENEDRPKDISTTVQILELLKEIGSSNLVEGSHSPCSAEPFHCCPLCSGRLLNV